MFSISIKSFSTVDSTYSWDDGVPVSSTLNTTFAPQSLQISGYAPYVCVEFASSGYGRMPSLTTGPTYQTYIDWNFGDYYNFSENIETTFNQKKETIKHAYCMPGEYTVSLVAREMYRVYTSPVYDAYQDVCRIGNALWNWSNTTLDKTNKQTWNAQLTSKKAWVEPQVCIDRYCIPWMWSSLQKTTSAIKWLDTLDSAKYSKLWSNEGSLVSKPCDYSTFNYFISTNYTYATNTHIKIHVLETPPQANLYCTSQSTTTSVPATAYLCADGCVAGSFPIQQIIWDLDDDTDHIVIDRFNISALTASNIFYNNSFPNDINDPRNYSIVNEYTGNTKTTFYPSISVYSCNTNTSDSCSTVFGPLIKQTFDITLVNARSDNDQLFLASTYLDTLCLHKIDLNTTEVLANNITDTNTPKNTIKNYPGKITSSSGNNGDGFAELIKNVIQNENI